MSRKLRYLDLFAGGGGLSEGFIRSGYEPVAHVEMDRAACFTLRTRTAYHYLKAQNREEQYSDYLCGRIKRAELYEHVPAELIQSVIHAEITKSTLSDTFRRIDCLLDNKPLDLIIGGPPCQSYSLVGRSRSANGMKGDRRNYLYTYYAEFLKRYKPACFLFENVPGLKSARAENGGLYLENMQYLFRECGYGTGYRTLSAQDHGIPQRRERVFLVGRHSSTASFDFPEPEKCKPRAIVEELLSDLPFLKAGQGDAGPCAVGSYHGEWLYETGIRNDDVPVTWHQVRPHNEQDLEIYRIAVNRWNNEKARLNYNELPEHLKTHRNRNSFLDRFKVVAGDLPYSHSVVAHIAKDGHYYIHPDILQNRSLTPREAARLQTFPDDYYFESHFEAPQRSPAFRQIGNAVPVLLAQKIADKLKEVWP